MAFPTTGVIDDFNRANSSTLGGNWLAPLVSAESSPQVESNGTTPPGASSAYQSGTLGPDTEVYLTIKTLPSASNQAHRLYARVQNPGTTSLNGYQLRWLFNLGAANDLLELYRVDNNVATKVGSTFYFITNELAAGDKIGLECIGSTISAYFSRSGGWKLAKTVTDTTYTAAGYVGYKFSGSTSGAADDFGGGTTTSTAPDIPTFPVTPVLDDFNRADGALGSNWSQPAIAGETAGVTILSNTIRGAATTDSAYWSAAAFGPDCETYADMTNFGSTCQLYTMILNPNSSGATDGYSVKTPSSTTIQLFRIDNDVATQMGPNVGTPSQFNGDKLGIRCAGGIIGGWTLLGGGSWTERISAEDLTYSAPGYSAIKFPSGASQQYDNFGGGTIVTGPPEDAGTAIVKLTPSGFESGPGDLVYAGLWDACLNPKGWF